MEKQEREEIKVSPCEQLESCFRIFKRSMSRVGLQMTRMYEARNLSLHDSMHSHHNNFSFILYS